jgi:TolB-like protein
MLKILISILLFTIVFPIHSAVDQFYNYYESGLKYMQARKYDRALADFKSAISLEFEDAHKKRTYDTRFIQYYPHRELGICFYYLGEHDNAMGELQLSYAYKKSNRAEEYIKKLSYTGGEIDLTADLKIKEQEAKKQEELALIQKELEDQLQKLEAEKQITIDVSSLPVGALTYDPSKVTQVGSRLSVAVLSFESNDGAANLVDSVTEKLITHLVNLRRFRVIERSALDKIMEEQKLGLTGFVDDDLAVKVGKLAGADVIILGRINLDPGFAKVNARGIDTETSELIVAKETESAITNISNIERMVETNGKIQTIKVEGKVVVK